MAQMTSTKSRSFATRMLEAAPLEAAPGDEVWDTTDDAVAGIAVEEAVLIGQNQLLVAVAAPIDAHSEAAAL